MLFNEIYGRYYMIMQKLLTMSHDKPLTEPIIKKVILEEGFDESIFHMYPKVIDETSTDFYQLFKSTGEKYQSILRNPPRQYITTLQQAWLKSLISDKRSKLFLQEYQLEVLDKLLKGVKPLYEDEDYQLIGQSTDGDPYDNVTYQKNFRLIICCLQKKSLMKITFKNRYGHLREGFYAPYRIEYSIKDDKFRLNAVYINRGQMINYSRLNIARIQEIREIPEAKIPDNLEKYILEHKVKEPVEIQLSDSRNGFDRCFINLSNYERRAEYDETTGKSNVKIYYYDFEETELLITLMSYGPILEVIGPADFRKKFAERVIKQAEINNRGRSNMKNVIMEKIRKIETDYEVKVLMAIESGSRGWGFPSTDSDYDVRFIYIHNKSWYLNVFEGKDTIDIPVNEVLDINGWDLKKAMKLLYKSNPPLIEWFSSPIIYTCEDDFVNEFRILAKEYFQPVSAIYHYTNLAKKSFRGVWIEDRILIKKLFYVIRPIFACLWIEKYGSIPPMNLQKMMAGVPDEAGIYDIINDLIGYKSGCTEKDTIESSKVLVDYLDNKVKYFEQYAKEIKQTKNNDASKLDEFFMNALDKWGYKDD